MDAELTKKIYSNNDILKDKQEGGKNSWKVTLRTMLHKTNDADRLVPASLAAMTSQDLLPVYEGKCGWQWDHRYSTYQYHEWKLVSEDLKNPSVEINTEYMLARSEYEKISKAYSLLQSGKINSYLGFRRVSRSTDERTMVACILPSLPSTYGWILSLGLDSYEMAQLCGIYNSLVFDYLVRNSISQPSIPQGVIEQIALPLAHEVDRGFSIPRSLELSYTSFSLACWAQDLGYDGPPFPFDPERRALLRAELDAYYANLYGLSRDELRYILDPADLMGPDYPSETFRVLKNNELRQFGEYRTQRLVLEAWDRLFGG
jgi:hypothetical protein